VRQSLLLLLPLFALLSACDSEPSSGDLDRDGFTVEQGDCNDSAADIHPGAPDLPGDTVGESNQLDEDCDGSQAVLCYIDADGDGFGNALQQTAIEPAGDCLAAANRSLTFDDCADNEPRVYPDNPEVCDGLDNNCDGEVDNDLEEGALESGYPDLDGDGDGATGSAFVEVCAGSADLAQTSSDCDDSDPSIYGAAFEICDGKDNNCDETYLIGEAPNNRVDLDGDGFFTCSPEGFVCQSNALSWDPVYCGDCDDSDPTINPSSYEICNDGYNNDCDSETDETEDMDGDGWNTCDAPEQGGGGLDCNDGNPDIYPGAEDPPCDGLDNDCNPATGAEDVDADGDGSFCSEDCDDSNAVIYPGASDLCDGIDNDCDGLTDEDEAEVLVIGTDPTMTTQLLDLLASADPGPSYCNTFIDGLEMRNNPNLANMDLSSFALVILAPDMADPYGTWLGPVFGTGTTGGSTAFTRLIEDSYSNSENSSGTAPLPVPSLLGMGSAGKALYTSLQNYTGYDWDGDGNADTEQYLTLEMAGMTIQCSQTDDSCDPPLVGVSLSEFANNPCSPLSQLMADSLSTSWFFDLPNPIVWNGNFASFIDVYDTTYGPGLAYPLWRVGEDPAFDLGYLQRIGTLGCTGSAVCWPDCSTPRSLLAREAINFLPFAGATQLPCDSTTGEHPPCPPEGAANGQLRTMLYHWGWDAPPAAWLDNGRKLFKNIVCEATAGSDDNPNCEQNTSP